MFVNTDDMENTRREIRTIRRTAIILSSFAAVVLSGLAILSCLVPVSLAVRSTRAPWNTAMILSEYRGRLRLDWRPDTTYAFGEPTPGHWWGNLFVPPEESQSQSQRVGLTVPAWVPIACALAYPGYMLTRLLVRSLRRGEPSTCVTNAWRRAEQPEHRLGRLGLSIATIALLLAVLVVSFSIASQWLRVTVIAWRLQEGKLKGVILSSDRGWCYAEGFNGPLSVVGWHAFTHRPHGQFSLTVERPPGALYCAGEAPSWVLITVLGVAPTIVLCHKVGRHRRLRQRRARGRCLSCGYDLTGNVSGTCPEYGRAVGDRSD